MEKIWTKVGKIMPFGNEGRICGCADVGICRHAYGRNIDLLITSGLINPFLET
jgi:hypothetical protein